MGEALIVGGLIVAGSGWLWMLAGPRGYGSDSIINLHALAIAEQMILSGAVLFRAGVVWSAAEKIAEALKAQRAPDADHPTAWRSSYTGEEVISTGTLTEGAEYRRLASGEVEIDTADGKRKRFKNVAAARRYVEGVK